MIGAIQNLVRSTDAAIARVYLGLFRERSALLSFLFHSLFRDEREIARGDVEPLDRTTVAQFRQFIEYYVRNGYRFVGPDDVLAGLEPGGRYALITFDDGYYNNTLALPVLEEFGVPALFFISTNHVRQNKCFWWDVLYRERVARGRTPRRIYHEAVGMKTLRTEQIESRLAEEFGQPAFTPRGDIDRPFSPAELREFAAHPLVRLGNHTANHAILTNYTPVEVYDQIATAQAALQEMTGKTPTAIAYPNGAHDDAVLGASARAALKLGFTIRPEKRSLPLPAVATSPEQHDLLRLGRFVPHAYAPMDTQCRTYRSDVRLYGAFRDAYLRMVRRQVVS